MSYVVIGCGSANEKLRRTGDWKQNIRQQPACSACPLMDEREVLPAEFTADQAKFKVTEGGVLDVGNGAK